MAKRILEITIITITNLSNRWWITTLNKIILASESAGRRLRETPSGFLSTLALSKKPGPF
jgi:hypothetical protein